MNSIEFKFAMHIISHCHMICIEFDKRGIKTVLFTEIQKKLLCITAEDSNYLKCILVILKVGKSE